MDRVIIRPGEDPLGEEPTFTITLTLNQAFAIRDAVTCIAMASDGGDANSSYREYSEYGWMEDAHQVADSLRALMEPHIRRVGAVIRAHCDASERRN